MTISEAADGFSLGRENGVSIIRMESPDGMNRLGLAKVRSMAIRIEALATEREPMPLIIAGNVQFFSAGADLKEIAQLSGADAYEFALAGQRLMNAIDDHPAPVIAAINGYSMGGGLDLALACDVRICSPKAVFGHRGAALGILTGWGGTQRLPRLIGKARALQMFLAAEKLHAPEALRIGLVHSMADDPVRAAKEWLCSSTLRT